MIGPAEQRDELARRFFAAADDGDLAGLEALLAADVQLTGDGGGRAPALARSLRGRARVAATVMSWIATGQRLPGVTRRAAAVNGDPGALFLDREQRVVAVWSLAIADGRVAAISSVVNPDKLAHLGPVGDFGSLLASSR